VLHTQQSSPFFPVDFRSLAATIEFVTLEPGPHLRDSRSFRDLDQAISHGRSLTATVFFQGAKSVVYSTDCEHKYSGLDESYPFCRIIYRNADLLIFDAMYSFGDMISVKEDWGHSSNVIGVELAQAAQVKRLVLFHHEPVLDDRMIEGALAETVRFEWISRRGGKVEVISAYDGLELTV